MSNAGRWFRGLSFSLALLVMISSVSHSAMEELLHPLSTQSKEPMPAKIPMAQGGEIKERISPYALNYAIKNRFNPAILSSLFERGDPQTKPHEGLLYISSYRHATGNWTYFKSSQTVIYEILNIKFKKSHKEATAVLYSTLPPERTAQAVPSQNSPWHLAIYQESKLAQIINLPFVWDGSEWLGGDMIYTDLRVNDGLLSVVITLVVTGSGGFPQRGFQYYFDNDEAGMRLSRVRRVDNGHNEFFNR